MADPLSIIGSIAGLVAVTVKTSVQLADWLSAVSDAPRHIVALHLGLKAVESVLLDLQRATRDSRFYSASTVQWILDVEGVIDGCMDTILELSGMVRKLSAKGKTWRAIRWIFKERDVKVLCDRLEGLKSTLTLSLSLLSALTGARAGERIEQVHGDVGEIRDIVGHLLAEQVVTNNESAEKGWGSGTRFGHESSQRVPPTQTLPFSILGKQRDSMTPLPLYEPNRAQGDHYRTYNPGRYIQSPKANPGPFVTHTNPIPPPPGYTSPVFIDSASGSTPARPASADPIADHSLESAARDILEGLPQGPAPEPVPAPRVESTFKVDLEDTAHSLDLRLGVRWDGHRDIDKSPTPSGPHKSHVQEQVGAGRGRILPQSTIAFAMHPSEDPVLRSQNIHNENQCSIFVGIRVGGSFSVSYTFVENNQAKELIMSGWPGQLSIFPKNILALLFYNENGKVVGWGNDVDAAFDDHGKPVVGVERQWFLDHLVPQGALPGTLDLPPLPESKTAIDVTADFLRELGHTIETKLEEVLGEVFFREKNNICYILTVPSPCLDSTKQALHMAMTQSGLIDNFRNHLAFKDEADAISCYGMRSGLLEMRPNAVVLTVNCGIEATTAIAHRTDSTVNFHTVTQPSGDRCGVQLVQKVFRSMVVNKLSLIPKSSSSPSLSHAHDLCMLDFYQRIMPAYNHSPWKWHVDLGIDQSYQDIGIEEGYMTYNHQDIFQCFEPTATRIVQLISTQIHLVERRRELHLDKILIAGVFAESMFLLETISDALPLRYRSCLVTPANPGVVAAQGAVSSAIMAKNAGLFRIARFHYVISKLQDQDDYKEAGHEDYTALGATHMNTGQVFIAKGDIVRTGQKFVTMFRKYVTRGAKLAYEEAIYVSSEDICPEYTNAVGMVKWLSIKCDLSIKTLENDFRSFGMTHLKIYIVEFEIVITSDKGELEIEIVCQGDILQRFRAQFF